MKFEIPQPTAKQIEIEKRSLERFCRRSGFTTEGFILACLGHGLYESEMWQKGLEQRVPGLGERCDALRLEKASNLDFWGERRKNEYVFRELAVEQFLSVGLSPHFSLEMVNHYLAELGEAPLLDKNQAVKKLLLKAPSPILFDLEFDGFVGKHKELGVSLSIYPHLFQVVNYACDILIRIAFQKTNRMLVFRTESELMEIVEADFVVEALLSLANWASGMAFSARFSNDALSSASYGTHFDVLTAANAGKNFVRFHEFSHLLFGHLGKAPSQLLETEADLYAAAVTFLASGRHDGAQVMASIGVAAVFGVFQILEDLGVTDLESHPTSASRVKKIADKVKWDRVETLFTVFVTAWRKAYERSKSMNRPIQDNMLTEAKMMAETELEHKPNLPESLRAILHDVAGERFDEGLSLAVLGVLSSEDSEVEDELRQLIEWGEVHSAKGNKFVKLGQTFLKTWIKELRKVICSEKAPSKELSKVIMQPTVPALISAGLLQLGVTAPLALSASTIALYTLARATQGAFCQMTDDEILEKASAGKRRK